MDRIRLVGLTLTGCHGLLREERERAQPFRVDVDLELDLAAAARSDDLSDTVDYGALTEALARVVREESYRLLERLAGRLAEVCVTEPKVIAATVEVAKLRPPVAEVLEAAAVRITRAR